MRVLHRRGQEEWCLTKPWFFKTDSSPAASRALIPQIYLFGGLGKKPHPGGRQRGPPDRRASVPPPATALWHWGCGLWCWRVRGGVAWPHPKKRHPRKVSALHATGILLAQLVFFHPLCRGFGECVTEANTLWNFEAGQTRLTPRLQLLRRGLDARP